MKQRIITSLITAALLVAIVLANPFFFRILCAAASVVVLREMYRAVGVTKNWCLTALGIAAALSFAFEQYSVMISFAYITMLFIIYLFFHNTLKLSDISKTFFITFYICLFVSTFVKISDMTSGHVLIWFVFLGAWSTDSFAYLVGISCGRHKLCPSISPKKTMEGAFGGIAGAVLVLVGYSLFLQQYWGFEINLYYVVLFGVVVSLFDQFGDLAASVIKREYGFKDFGTMLPGHGGIMDRVDGLLFAAPAAFVFFIHLGEMMIKTNF